MYGKPLEELKISFSQVGILGRMWSLHVPLCIQSKLTALEVQLIHLMGTDVSVFSSSFFFPQRATALLEPRPLPFPSSEITYRHTTLWTKDWTVVETST